MQLYRSALHADRFQIRRNRDVEFLQRLQANPHAIELRRDLAFDFFNSDVVRSANCVNRQTIVAIRNRLDDAFVIADREISAQSVVHATELRFLVCAHALHTNVAIAPREHGITMHANARSDHRALEQYDIAANGIHRDAREYVIEWIRGLDGER